MNTKRLLCIVTAVFLFSGTANATFILTLDDPSTSEIDLRIVDQDSNDTSPAPGIIGLSLTTIGGVPVSGTATSKPLKGSITSPNLVLSFQSTAAGGGRVILSVTDTDFNANLPYKAGFNGGTGGTLRFDFFGDSNNREFGRSFDIASTGILTGNIDQSFTSGGNPVGSLTISIDIGFTGIGQTAGGESMIEAVPLSSRGMPGILFPLLNE